MKNNIKWRICHPRPPCMRDMHSIPCSTSMPVTSLGGFLAWRGCFTGSGVSVPAAHKFPLCINDLGNNEGIVLD